MISHIMLSAAAPTANSTGIDYTGYYIQPIAGQAIGLGIYCLATLVAVGIALYKHASFKDVLSDKSMLRAMPGGLADDDSLPTSFSRLAGLIGVAYLTAFLWGIGFFVLASIWVAPTAIAQVIADCGQFLMAGSALFAPYAFNQLAQIFTPKAAPTSSTVGTPTPSNGAKLRSADIDRLLTPPD